MAHRRRNVLKGGLAMVAGLVGAGAAGTSLLHPLSKRASASPAEHTTMHLVLHGHRWQITKSGAEGQLPAQGDRMTAFGSLSLEPRGPAVGEFHGTYTALRDPGQGRPRGIATLEHHTFVLEEGTILGSGVGTPARAGGRLRHRGRSGSVRGGQRNLCRPAAPSRVRRGRGGRVRHDHHAVAPERAAPVRGTTTAPGWPRWGA
jgi:hypothetical protein